MGEVKIFENTIFLHGCYKEDMTNFGSSKSLFGGPKKAPWMPCPRGAQFVLFMQADYNFLYLWNQPLTNEGTENSLNKIKVVTL